MAALRKALTSDVAEFTYERKVQHFRKLGSFRERLDALLLEDAGRPRRDKLRLTRIWDLLVQDETLTERGCARPRRVAPLDGLIIPYRSASKTFKTNGLQMAVRLNQSCKLISAEALRMPAEMMIGVETWLEFLQSKCASDCLER